MNPSTTGRRTIFRAAFAALVHCAAFASVQAATPAPAPGVTAGVPRAAFERAVGDFHRGRFSAAYGQFVRMADHGDVRAAAIALLMYREGRVLFRTEWDASTEQVEGWESLAVTVRQRAEVSP